jgi:hypothetical protein
MKYFLILFILVGCNTVKKIETIESKKDDSSYTSIDNHTNHNIEDNLNIKRDNGTWTRTIVYPPSENIHSVSGIIITESGTYNRDIISNEKKVSYQKFNAYQNFNVTKTIAITKKKTSVSRIAWIPMLLLAIGGIGVFLATRVPLIVKLVMALINFLISKFKKNKNE